MQRMFQRSLRCLKAPKLSEEFLPSLDALQIPQGNSGKTSSTTPAVIAPKITNGVAPPSQKVMDFANKSKIKFPNALQLVPRQRLNDFPIRFSLSSSHVFSIYHLKYLSAFEHPLTEKTLHYYTKKKETRRLWSYVHASSASDGSNAVVWSASERVARAALCRALNAAGYDASGNSLHGEKSLRGTIRISIPEPKKIFKVEFGDLVDYLSKLLSDAIPRLSGHKRPSR
ncbi:uncharacterized protein B0T15DRAFT_72302 [Chaetomium strumarium]|uniref:Uncharacterized protein n=1 Tax=Chaetomium strumarium TaxID=1170767 RepID=A0AAJ0M767_9PEZI|nr:hypothetical protein B0T15DRAFT_72302 [Chaetomium strumarium]